MADYNDLWLEFLGPDTISSDWMENRSVVVGKNIHCGLCGNSGIVDTRGVVKTPTGYPCGVRRYCICPNGRTMMGTKQQIRES